MAISPPSDIVLDVARAVDHSGIATARLQLQRRAAAAGAATPFPDVRQAGEADMRSHAKVGNTDPQAASAFQKFEAVVLQTFLQSMLPADGEAVFGKGLAGDMWKAQLAEHLAGVMARNGGIGIANRLLKDHYMQGEKAVPLAGASDGPARAEADRQHMLSVALVQEIQRKRL